MTVPSVGRASKDNGANRTKAKPNKLRDKIGSIPAKLDPSVVQRVEIEVAAFNAEVKSELGDRIAEIQELSVDGHGLMDDSERRKTFYGFVHRLWGDAPSQGHPLLGRAAESLCLLLGNDDEHDSKQVAILEHHVAAIASIWGNRHQGDRLAESLVRSLEESTLKYKP